MDGIEEQIFHGINVSNYQKESNLEEIDIFESILKYGKVLTRKDLKECGYQYINDLPSLYSQNPNEVCFAIHPKATSFYEDDNIGDAFYSFVRFHLSFIFNSSMLNKVKSNTAFGMAGEIRVIGSVILNENLIGVGYFDEIMYTLDKIRKPKTNYQLNPFYQTLISFNDVWSYIENRREKLYFIKDLLKRYKMDVPIVDPLTGKLVNDNKEKGLEEISKVLRKNKELT